MSSLQFRRSPRARSQTSQEIKQFLFRQFFGHGANVIQRIRGVTQRYTPTLHKLAQEGVRFGNHHSVYLSSTEVNGAAISTGAYPAHSGILANKEYRPSINLLKPLGTESREAVRGGDRLTQGRYLKMPTLAEILQAAGYKTAVAGTKPVALLHDRKERDEHDRSARILWSDNTIPTNDWECLVQDLGLYP